MQAGAYQNGCWVVGVAKAGVEEGVEQIGATAIIAPSGEIVARSSTNGEELVIHRCDLDLVKPYKERSSTSAATGGSNTTRPSPPRPPRRRRRRGREAANGGAAVLWHGRPARGASGRPAR